MYQIMKLEDIVSANAKAMVRFMNVTDFRFFVLSAAVAIGTYGLYLQDKGIKKLKEDIRVMKAEILLDEKEIKVLREKIDRGKTEKES